VITRDDAVADPGAGLVPLRSAAGAALITATVLASMVGFLDAYMINVAVPAIGHDLHASVSELQCVRRAGAGSGRTRASTGATGTRAGGRWTRHACRTAGRPPIHLVRRRIMPSAAENPRGGLDDQGQSK
jgi:hypothetical protein